MNCHLHQNITAVTQTEDQWIVWMHIIHRSIKFCITTECQIRGAHYMRGHIVLEALRYLVSCVCLSYWVCFTVPRFICVHVCAFYACFHTAYVLYCCNMVGWTWWDWSLWSLSFFGNLSVLWHCWLGHLTVGSFEPCKPVPNMTYNVCGGMSDIAQLSYVHMIVSRCFWEHMTVSSINWWGRTVNHRRSFQLRRLLSVNHCRRR